MSGLTPRRSSAMSFRREGRNPQVLGERVDAHIERLQVILAQHLAGVYRPHAVFECHGHVSSLCTEASVVVINDLDILGARGGPPEAHAKLVVDTNAVLSLAVILQRLQLITWRGSQKLQRFRRIQLRQLPGRHLRDGSEPLGLAGFEEALGVLAAKLLIMSTVYTVYR